MSFLLLTQLTSLLETAIQHEGALYAREYATYTYVYVSHASDELAIDLIWSEALATELPWQPLRLHGVASQQFWQVLELAEQTSFDYGATLMPANNLPITRLTAAARFRQQRGLGEQGRWAILSGSDLEMIQQILAAYPPGSQMFSSTLTEIGLSELGVLAHQLAQWQNDDLEAEVATAIQWVQQEKKTFLPSPAALLALGSFTWYDGITVEQLSATHTRPRQLQAVLAWLPTNPMESIPLQIIFHDARLPDVSITAERCQADTAAFCQDFDYGALACQAENRIWLTNNGQQQTDETGATIWVLASWQLVTLPPTYPYPPELTFSSN